MIATDGSDAAIDATQRAIALLRADAQIVLLTVIPEKEDPMDTARGIEGPAMTEEEADLEYENNVAAGQEALARTANALGHQVEARLAPADTEAGHAIVDCAREVEPDLVVIGSSDKGLLKRIFTGSVSDYVV